MTHDRVGTSVEERGRGRLPGIRAPKRVLSASFEKSLSTRQLEILGQLEELVIDPEFAELTMADIAKRMSCSLRLLYGIASNREALVLAIADRRLRRIGREAMKTLEVDEPAIDRLRAYLRVTNRAVQPTTAAFARNFGGLETIRSIGDSHSGYITAVTRALLDEAVEANEIEPLDTSALAVVLGQLGNEFSRPGVEKTLQCSAQETADSIAEIILYGLLSRPASPVWELARRNRGSQHNRKG